MLHVYVSNIVLILIGDIIFFFKSKNDYFYRANE